MKILIATGLYSPEIGGPATYVEMLENRLPPQGFELVVVPFSSVKKYPKVLKHLVYLWNVWRASKTCDVIYALDPISVGLPACLAARMRRKKFMLRLGGDYAWEQGRVRFGVTATLDEYTENPRDVTLFVRLLAKLQTAVAKRAAVVIAPSNYLKNIIVRWGVPAEQIFVIYSSVVPIETSVGRDDFRRKAGLQSPIIATAGRLVPWKGVRVLIDVVADLKKDFPDVTLLIIGDGPQEQELKSHVSKFNLEQNVLFAGRLNKTEMANTISAADVFVLNTAYEGISHQLLEVMHLGVPIVTTTAGGNTELLSDGVDSFLISFNKKDELQTAISTVITNPESAKRLTQFARARSREFSEDRVIKEFVELVKSV